jgi:hypothetical protein
VLRRSIAPRRAGGGRGRRRTQQIAPRAYRRWKGGADGRTRQRCDSQRTRSDSQRCVVRGAREELRTAAGVGFERGAPSLSAHTRRDDRVVPSGVPSGPRRTSDRSRDGRAWHSTRVAALRRHDVESMSRTRTSTPEPAPPTQTTWPLATSPRSTRLVAETTPHHHPCHRPTELLASRLRPQT